MSDHEEALRKLGDAAGEIRELEPLEPSPDEHPPWMCLLALLLPGSAERGGSLMSENFEADHRVCMEEAVALNSFGTALQLPFH